MNRIQKIKAIVTICAFALPSLIVLVKGTESFPYTNCPMFAHYIGEDTYFYDIKFVGKDGQLIRPKCENTSELQTNRLFLNKIYGSAEANTPYDRYTNDSSAAFEKRMEMFFAGYFKHVPLEAPDTDTIRLEISQYNREYVLLDTHTVGVYDVLSKKFKHTWSNQL